MLSFVIERQNIGYLEHVVQRLQFCTVHCRQTAEPLLTQGGEPDQYLAPISSAFLAADQASRLTTIHQRQGAMRLHLQPISKFADGGCLPAGHALDMQQEEILLGRQALTFSRLLAEAQEATKLVSELGQCFKVRLRQFF